MSQKRIDTKKIVAKIFEEGLRDNVKETETVTRVLASGRGKKRKSFQPFNLRNLVPSNFRHEFGGIDIGSSSVKFILMGHDKSRILIKDVHVEKLAKLSGVERREEKEKELQNALMKIASHVKSKTKVGIALNEPSLFAEAITVQTNPNKELKQIVQRELADKHLIDPSTNFFDFVPTGAPDTLNHLQGLFVVAAPRELVYRQFGVAQSAGFRVLSVETNALATLYSLKRVLRWEQTDKVLFLDIGFRYTNLGILMGGRLIFNRIIPIAGERFTKIIERDMKCDFESAEQLKVQYGLKYAECFASESFQKSARAQEGELVSKSLEHEVQALLNEVERSFQFAFKSEVGGGDSVKFQSIHLFGGSSRMNYLKDYLEKRWEAPVRNVDLWGGFILNERSIDSDFLKESNDLMSVALGVGLRVTEF